MIDEAVPLTELTLFYIPDKSFDHSQLRDSKPTYREILLTFHDVYDDQGRHAGRGSKTRISTSYINPIENL